MTHVLVALRGRVPEFSAKAGATVVVRPFQVVDLALPDALKKALPLKEFDMVMSNDALMHLPNHDVFAALANLNGAGVPGGVFITNTDTRRRYAVKGTAPSTSSELLTDRYVRFR